MNRKLHNTILAFSISGAMLVVGLMAASPPPAGHALADAPDSIDDAHGMRAARIGARTTAFETEIAEVRSTGELLAATSVFIADVATEATLLSLADELNGAAAPVAGSEHTQVRSDNRPPDARPLTGKRKRSALAMPYFSFAQGLRRGSGR